MNSSSGGPVKESVEGPGEESVDDGSSVDDEASVDEKSEGESDRRPDRRTGASKRSDAAEEEEPEDTKDTTGAGDVQMPATRPGTGRLRRLIVDTVQRHLPEPSEQRGRVEEPPRKVGTYARWLPVLRAVPWVLGAVFAASFAWDFPGVEVTVFGWTVVVEGLLRITAVSGLIGFLTNWLAITMLFQPREPRPLVGQGVIPSQRERVAYRLAEAVSDELINEAIIMEKIHESVLAAKYRDLALSVARDVTEDEAFRRELKQVTADYLRDVLSSEEVRERIVDFTETQIEKNAGEGLPGLALRLYRTFGEDAFQARLREAVSRLPEAVDPLMQEADAVLDRLPEQIERRADEIEDLITQIVLRFVEAIDVQRIVLENVRNYDERQLEALLKRTTNEQLNYIKYLGGVLGVVGGLVIWAPVVSLIALTAIGLAIYAVDEALYRSASGDSGTGQ